MPSSFSRIPPDSTGNRIRTRTKVQAAETVHEQAVFLGTLDTFYALADTVTFANNKFHITVMNTAGSGKLVQIRDVRAINIQTASVAGVACRFDFKRISAASGGTSITVQPVDSDAPLPAGIEARTGNSATEGPLLYPRVFQTDEVSGANTHVSSYLTQLFSQAARVEDAKDLVLREGQGFTVKQVTSTVVGTYAWQVVFTVEDI